MEGLLGKKIGMTRVFDAQGDQIPVTVLEAGPCVVLQRKTRSADGYEAVQLGFGEKPERRAAKAAAGHTKKAGTTPKRFIQEFRVAADEDLAPGQQVTVSIFEKDAFVDVQGVTKGRGFQGFVRRHHMRGGPKTHGGHSKRRVGSIGQSSFPARVSKNKRMAGHMGHVRVSQRGLRVVDVREQDHLLLVRGAVPGPTGSFVAIRKSKKKAGRQL